MRLPTYDELASEDEQLTVLEHPLDKSLFVVGPPGSGKTVLAVQRAGMVAKGMGTTSYQPTLLITFSRMLRRLLNLLGGGSLRAQTAQSFVWQDCVTRTGKNPPTSSHDPYEIRWPALLEELRQVQRGTLLPHIVIDEGQDLPAGLFTYVRGHVAQSLTVFADENQALGKRHTTLEEIKQAAALDDPVILEVNHRNTLQIAQVAEHFHGGNLPAATVRRTVGERPRLVRRPDTASAAELISNWYKNRGGSIGVIVQLNETGRGMRSKLKESLPGSVRVDFYEHSSRNEDSINVLQPGITVLNKESVKGQEFDAVFILELERFLPCADAAARRAMYMMCTRARDHLFLINGSPLSARVLNALPEKNLLERK